MAATQERFAPIKVPRSLTKNLESNHTDHIVCSKDEHASIGVAENSIGVLRTSAKAMMLAGNIPKRFLQFVVSHAAYLDNIVAPSRCDRTKTIFEVLSNRHADVRRIPPIGVFCAVYTDRRQLQDQSFGLTSKQGIFIGIARYKKVLGYVVPTENLSSLPEITSPVILCCCSSAVPFQA